MFKKYAMTMQQWVKKERYFLLAALLAGVCTTGVLAATKAYAETTQKHIAQGLIRFHVRANSNLPQDQRLKLAVKDKILMRFESELQQIDSIEEAKEVMFLRLDDIEQVAREEIRRQGYDYPVTVSLKTDYFPTRQYGELQFPPGAYETLAVDIGNGSGQNWWCVVYPPLCYVDVTQKEVTEETKAQLKENLPPEEYELVALSHTSEEKNNLDVKIKFKIVEWWQQQKMKQTKIAAKTS